MIPNQSQRTLLRLHSEEQHGAARRELALSIIEAHVANPQADRRALKAALALLKPSLECLEPEERQLADAAKLWSTP